jgi:hypothetical protein
MNNKRVTSTDKSRMASVKEDAMDMTTAKRVRRDSPTVLWHNRPDTTDISCLYPELLTIIFQNLEVTDKGRAAQVCRSWRDSAYNKSVWKGVEAKLHLKKTSSSRDPNIFPSLVRRGIKKIQVSFSPFLHG